MTAVVAVLALAACTTTVAGHPVPAGGSVSHPAGEPAKAPKPKDRDPQAVTVALRKLDACGIFDLNAAKAGTPGAALLPTGPHSCMLAPTANYSPADHGVEVLVGDKFSQSVAYHGAPVTIAGARAYESRDYSTSKRCELTFPVSFTRAITFTYDVFNDIDTCQVLHQIAQASVMKLQNPDALTVDPAKRPGSAWDGCSFLAELLGPDAKNYTYEPEGLHDPFSGCKTRKKTGDNAAPSAGYGPELEVAYDQVPTAPGQSRQIADKLAEVHSYTGNCALSWNQSDSHTGNQWYAALVVKLTAATCDTAASLAEKAVQLAGQAPGDADAAPQRPLLLKADEPDTDAVGACLDFGVTGGQADCEPYHHVSIPQGTDKIMAAAAADRNVQCAVFSDAVTTLFGSSFAALTWGAHCFFVEPTHTLDLRVNVDPDNPPSDYGKRQDLWIERQETQLAGKPAITFWDKDKNSFDIYLSPFNDLNRKGNVHINIEALNGRGNLALNRAKLDPAKAQTAVQVITQITQKYFAG